MMSYAKIKLINFLKDEIENMKLCSEKKKNNKFTKNPFRLRFTYDACTFLHVEKFRRYYLREGRDFRIH